MSVGSLLPAILAVVPLRRQRLLDLARPTPAAVRRLLVVGAPALGSSLGLNVVFRGDRYVLGLFEGTAPVAVYSLAATLAESFRFVPISLGQVLYRQMSLRDGQRPRAALVVVPLVVTGAAGLALTLIGWFAIPRVFGPAFDDARLLLVVLVAAEICFAPFFVAAGGLLGGGHTRLIGSIGGVGALVTLCLYTAGVATWGMWGAAVASLLAYSGLSVAATLALRGRWVGDVAAEGGHDAVPAG